MIDTIMQAATEAMLGLTLFIGVTTLFAVAIELVKSAYGTIHPN